ncbi:ATP-grasp domain-containing protein, partial [Gammaproteobacteria bacterium]|nr:ATP-grasp domain-containing protein [Gammaproteobacteria bacterium]
TKNEAIAHAETLQSPVFQPYIEGEEISIDSWCDGAGVLKGCILRYRNLVINGESQITTTFRNQEIEDKIEKIINKLEIKGHAVLQAIIDAGGNVHLIEINARFGGASTVSIAAGLDSFYWTLCELGKGQIPNFKRSEGDIAQVRYSQDMLI